MMKVQPQVQPQPAVSQNATAKTADAKPAAANAAAPAANASAGQVGDQFSKDAFVPGRPPVRDFPPIRDWPPYGPLPLPPKDTMNFGDHLTAGRLPDALSNPLDKPLLDAGKKDQHLTRDDQGVMRGPDGQPLAKVQLKDGNTAYVDPNTNQYYLTDEKETFFPSRGVNALGPLPLPKNAQFSNSYFSDADVRSIERDARGGNIWPPINPLPRPIPFPNPIPLPKPIPFDPPWRPQPIDPGIFLDATAAKTNGVE